MRRSFHQNTVNELDASALEMPLRARLIYVTGVFELLAGIAVLIPGIPRPAGFVLWWFLIAILPSNIYAALHRVDFGGHKIGPKYLLVRHSIADVSDRLGLLVGFGHEGAALQ